MFALTEMVCFSVAAGGECTVYLFADLRRRIKIFFSFQLGYCKTFSH